MEAKARESRETSRVGGAVAAAAAASSSSSTSPVIDQRDAARRSTGAEPLRHAPAALGRTAGRTAGARLCSSPTAGRLQPPTARRRQPRRAARPPAGGPASRRWSGSGSQSAPPLAYYLRRPRPHCLALSDIIAESRTNDDEMQHGEWLSARESDLDDMRF